MPLKGGYTIEINKEKHTIGPGDIFVIAPGELHTLYAPESGERLIVLVDYSIICTLNGMKTLLQSFHPYKCIRSAENEELYESLTKHLLEIEKEYFAEENFFEAKIYSLIISFFVELARSGTFSLEAFSGFPGNKQHEYISKFLNVCNYINEHFSEDIDADVLAGIAGFSKFHFSRLFKQYTGSTYYEYLTRRRIEMAEKLLIAPEMSITEVAMQSGFNSLSTFNRVFKNVKGCTPSEYKGMNKKNSVPVN